MRGIQIGSYKTKFFICRNELFLGRFRKVIVYSMCALLVKEILHCLLHSISSEYNHKLKQHTSISLVWLECETLTIPSGLEKT
jgi:hypothetical protein